MIPIRNLFFLPLLAALFVMAGCDGIVTGEPAHTLPLSENSEGGYGPIPFSLTPDMSPVALNFRAEHGDDPSEIGKWNAYRATLSKDGREIASGAFNINHTGSPDSPGGAPFIVRTMMTVSPTESGDYALSITPTKPVEVRLSGTQLEVRRNVRSGDTLN
jgi:hypothetical protein